MENDKNVIGGKSRPVMILICLLLGSIGIHNFMFGETKKGIVKIILVFVWRISILLMIYDLIKLIRRTYVIEPEKFI